MTQQAILLVREHLGIHTAFGLLPEHHVDGVLRAARTKLDGCLLGPVGGMRREHRMRRLANGRIERNGFLLEHVDAGTPELARDKRLGQRIGIHDVLMTMASDFMVAMRSASSR